MIYKFIAFCLRISTFVLPLSVLILLYTDLRKRGDFTEGITSYMLITLILGLLFVSVCLLISKAMIRSLSISVLQPSYVDDYLLIKSKLIDELSLGSRRIISALIHCFFIVLSIPILCLCSTPLAIGNRQIEEISTAMLYVFIIISALGYIFLCLLKLALWIRKGYK